MGRFLKPSIALGLTFLAAACAAKWVKPGATDADFQAIKTACTARAIALFPPRITQVMADSQPIAKPIMSCNTMNSNGMMGGNTMMQSCDPDQGSFVVPNTMITDSNAGARDADARNCLIASGWQLAKAN